jgi:hypothetical protein
MAELGAVDKSSLPLSMTEVTGWILSRVAIENGSLVLYCEPSMENVLKDYLRFAKIETFVTVVSKT